MTHRSLLIAVAVLGVAAVLAMVVLWPGEQELPPTNPAQTTEVVDATLTSVEELEGVESPGLTPGAVMVSVQARIDETGETVEFETSDETGSLYRPGQRVRLSLITQEGLPPTYFITDFRRSTPLLVLAGLFITAVIWFGRLQGVRALVGLALTFVLIIGFMIPAILDGTDPLLVAIVGSSLIMILTLYLSHGLSPKTTAAVVGTALALLTTGVLAVIFVGAANITGFASEEARMANVQTGGLSLQGLLLAGIVIGALGVLDDVTMTQASAVFQLHRADRTTGFRGLVSGALAVGRDHVAATVNTLFLAYAGASLPLLILFAGSPDGVGTVLATETVAVEIIRALVGSLGLIAAVPLTTALAAALVLDGSSSGGGKHTQSATESQHHPTTENSIDESMTTATESAETPEWEQKLRDAYRLPPSEQG